MTPQDRGPLDPLAPPPLPRRPGAPRWKALRDAAAPVLSAPALVAAVVLAVSLFFGAVFQFFTSLYDVHVELAYAHSMANAVLALVLAVLMLLRPTWHRAHVIMLGLAVLVLAGSFWITGAKQGYRRGLLGDDFYSLPHQGFRYEAPAETVTFTTNDGVQLVATSISHRRTRGVVIYPSWRTNRDAFSVATLAQWMGNDIDVLVVDPRGQGDSQGAKTPDGQDKNDVLAAVAYMHGTGHMHVGVLAEEDGAVAAIEAGTLHQGIDSMALVAPYDKWGGSLGQEGRLYDPNGLPGRFYWRIAAGLRLAPGAPAPPIAEAIRYVAPTPLLLAGCKTEAGSLIDQLHMAAGEPKSLIVLGGTGRPVDWTHFAEYYKEMEQWFDLTLRAAETNPPDVPLTTPAQPVPAEGGQ